MKLSSPANLSSPVNDDSDINSLPCGLSTCSSRSREGGAGNTRPSTIKGRGRARTPEDDFFEVRLATWLGMTWLTGVATPLAFLVCCALFSIGPNRLLFSPVSEGMANAAFYEVSNLEILAGLSRLWSVNIFKDHIQINSALWYVPDETQVNDLVTKLLCVSFSHICILFVGSCWLRYRGDNRNSQKKIKFFSRSISGISRGDYSDPFNHCRASRDVWGVMSALLEYHYNIIGLTTVLTMAIIFSLVFPWYGMNSLF